ncbi:hypothetical protein ACDA63_16035 [Uliginosibacterium sp. sgz301328]|uniref:hypothetical protein n=1 Tax=Uliginosibacterium sp. sgz301328 TaxID=3243764 RepID=UPI00359DA0A5
MKITYRLTLAIAASLLVHTLVIGVLEAYRRAPGPRPSASRLPTRVHVQLVKWHGIDAPAQTTAAAQQPAPAPAEAAATPLPGVANASVPTASADSTPMASPYLSAREVDYPAEFAREVDFDQTLQNVPVMAETVRVAILINARGTADDVMWLGAQPQPAVLERFTPYLMGQPYRPAMKNGQPVASRMVLEFSIGQPGSDIPEFNPGR